MNLQLTKPSLIFWRYIIFLAITIVGVCKSVSGQITESFESGLPTAYTTTTSYTLSSGVWTGQANGVIQGTTNPCAGTKVLQLRSQTGAQITSPNITTGVGTITFCASGSTTSAAVQVNYSTDGGTTWTAATGSTFSLGTTATNYTATVNSCAANILVQFYRTAATVYIDNITINAYSCGCTPPSDPPNPTAAANPACTSTTLTEAAAPAGVTYYWQGTTSSGTSTASLASSSYTVTTSGTYYVRAQDNTTLCWSSGSGAIAVTINTPITITGNPSASSVCAGSNTTFTVSASGTSPTYQWQVNTGSGFSNLSNSAPYSGVTTATLNITSATTSMNGYTYQCVVSGASPCGSSTSSSAALSVTIGGEPTAAPSSASVTNVGCNGFTLSWANGNGNGRVVVLKAGSVPTAPTDGTTYTANAMFGSGSTTAAGSYVVYSGSGSSVVIYGLSASTTYYYSVYEYGTSCSINYLTSSSLSGSQTTGSCSTPAGLLAVYVDACGTTTGCGFEGNNELIWGMTGSYIIPTVDNAPVIHYGGSTNPTTTYISTYSSNSTNTTNLNTAVGTCGTTTFIDAGSLGYIPPNSSFLIANSCLCDPVPYDFSNLCGQTVYVIFGTNSTWTCGNTGGVFGNHQSSGTAYFNSDFSAVIPGLVTEYNYDKNTLSSGDGAYVTLDPSGGAALSYGSGACTVPAIVLSVRVDEFTAVNKSFEIDLAWKVSEEMDLSHYIIEKSHDSQNYIELAKVEAGSGRVNNFYQFIDDKPYQGFNYYKLSSVDNDGKITYQKSAVVDYNHYLKDNYAIYYGTDFVQIELKNTAEDASIDVVDLSGLVISTIKSTKDANGIIRLNSENFQKGMYLLRIKQQNKVWNDKIIIR